MPRAGSPEKSDGGDNYTMFKQATNPVIYSDQVLYDVISAYFGWFSPIN